MADIDLVQESLNHAQLKKESMLEFVSSAIGQRIQFHRDIVTLSLLLLGGIVALFNLDSTNTLIRTEWMLYVAGVLSMTAALISTVTRVMLLGHLQNMVATMNSWLGNISVAVKDVRGKFVQANPPATESDKAVAINKLVEAENPAPLPYLNKLGEHGHKISAGLFIASIVSIAVSLLLKIS